MILVSVTRGAEVAQAQSIPHGARAVQRHDATRSVTSCALRLSRLASALRALSPTPHHNVFVLAVPTGGGTITVVGPFTMFPGAKFNSAIVGGTGRYASASGWVSTHVRPAANDPDIYSAGLGEDSEMPPRCA
jgi:hypothetical protein